MAGCISVNTDTDKAIEILGLIGGLLFTICNIPQIYKIIKTKSSSDLSYPSLFIYIIGIISITIYSIYFDLLSIYVPSLIECIFALLLIILKYIYDKKKINTPNSAQV